ncbi:MAG TPA: hypothetical protein VJ302_21935 [Blastocatellia bacterium]|nr:hypothetical protein [Blastocatellia bacterium]
MTTVPDQATISKLMRAIVAKSMIELLLVCAVATIAAFSNFSPLLRGAIDVADHKLIAGWVHDPLSPAEAIEVMLFIDGQFVAARRADERRDDLVAAGATTIPNHGFTFALDPAGRTAGTHTAQVYAVRHTSGSHKVLIPISRLARTFDVRAEPRP